MITLFCRVVAKAGREGECVALAKELMVSTREQDHGCMNYTIYRRSDNSRELVLYEQWRDIEALDAHIARLQKVFGLPDAHEPYPPTHHRRRWPKVFLDLFETTDAARYDSLD